jgi:isopentenyl-diphosphate delta-isomerase
LKANEEGLRLGELFRNWGLSTEQSLIQCVQMKKKLKSNIELVATGGIRNGIHVAKGVALGATMNGIGLPLFRAAASPQKGMTAFESVEKELEFFIKSLLITMFCSGSKELSQLSSKIV